MSDVLIVPQPAPFAVPFSGGTEGPPGAPGGNIMAIGLFTAAAALSIPGGTNLVKTSGYSADGRGSAEYVYDAAVNGAYVTANPLSSFISANSRGFRLSLDQQLNATMFGVVADGTTNDGPAMVAALAFCFNNAGANLTGYGTGCPTMRVPFTPNGINMGTSSLAFIKSVALVADSGAVIGGVPTMLKWAANCIGILIQAPNCYLDGLYLKGGWVGGTTSEGEYHAIKAYWKFGFGRLWADSWQGDGLHVNITAGSGGDTEGNANGIRGQTFVGTSCRCAISTAGSDANACHFGYVEALYCRQAGVLEQSGLGNHYGAVLTESNTIVDVGTNGTPYVTCYNNGFIFAVATGQAGNAPTTSPPSTATNNSVWLYCRAATGPKTYAPQWVSGTQTFREGGGFHTASSLASNASTVGYLYSESDQPVVQTAQGVLILSGLVASGFGPNTRYIQAGNLGVSIGSILNCVGELTVPVGPSLFGNSGGIHGTIQGTTWNAFSGFAGGNTAFLWGKSASGFLGAKNTSTGFVIPLEISANSILLENGSGQQVGIVDSNGLGVTMGGLGYRTGVGGTVTQATSKSTGVTLNKSTGKITLNNASLAANTEVSFTFTNSQIAANDIVRINVSGAATPGSYLVQAENAAAGSCVISVRNLTGGALSEALGLNFVVIKGATS